MSDITAASAKSEQEVNFNLTLPPTLETERIRLVPFDLAVHGKLFYDAMPADLARWMPFSFPTYESFVDVIEHFLDRPKDAMAFAVLDKTKPDHLTNLHQSLAGLIGYIDCSPSNRSVEIGPVMVLPAFQRTFVATNAIGILLKAVLNLPEEGGQGFRRVVWTANPMNAASVKAAERMGFKKEGVMRWMWNLPEGKEGKQAPSSRGAGLGRDSVLLSLCWDDWEDGGKEKVEALINRA